MYSKYKYGLFDDNFFVFKIFMIFQEEEDIMQIRLTRIVTKISYTYLQRKDL